MQTKASLTVNPSSPTAVADTVRSLRDWGVAFLPGFLDDTSALGADFNRAIADSRAQAAAQPPAKDAQGKNIAPADGHFLGETATGVHLKLDGYAKYRDIYSSVAELFGHPFMREVANSYLGLPNSLNRHVILTHDFKESAAEILPFHFDEMRSLKFYVYVDDAEADGGPFEIIPGTHKGGEFIRMSEWHRVGKYNEIRSWVLEQYSEDYLYAVFGAFKGLLKLRTVTLAGKAGTLIIFDTDSLHRGGPFAGTRERRVVRGSSYTGMWP